MENKIFEVALGKQVDNHYDIVGTSYSGALSPDSSLVILKASFLAIEKIKLELSKGHKISVSLSLEFPEIRPVDLIISNGSEFETVKNAAINEIAAIMHQTIIGVSVIDAMDYLDNYMKMMNNGIFITDQNRDDKYFQIIEAAQSIEKPAPLLSSSTWEEEQKFNDDMKKYSLAQTNLSNLEKYLNAYDKLLKIKYVTDLLDNTKAKINAAKTIKEVNDIVVSYKNALHKNEESTNEI